MYETRVPSLYLLHQVHCNDLWPYLWAHDQFWSSQKRNLMILQEGKGMKFIQTK